MPDSRNSGIVQNAKWNTPIGMLHSRTQDVQDYVLIGKDTTGQPVLFSSGDETQAQGLLAKFGNFQNQGSRQSA